MSKSDRACGLAPTAATTLARALAIAAALGFMAVSGAAAQDTSTQPATPTVADAAPPALDLPLGQEVPTGPAPIATQETATVGETYLATRFGEWEQRCVKTEDGSDPCQLYQLLKDETNQPAAEVYIFTAPAAGEAAAGASVVVPLETLLTAGLQLSIDNGKTKAYELTVCVPIGCVANFGLTAEEVDRFRKGNRAVVSVVPAFARDQKVNINISLNGFTAGFKAISETNPKVKTP